MAGLKGGILISGRGSNMAALIDACAAADFPADVVLVAANNPDAAGLSHASDADIETRIIDHRTFADRAAFEDALDAALREAGVELVCLAGFMRLLGAEFLRRWHDRVLNIHPSLLPAFRGLNAHEQAIDSGVRISGCTVHIVRPEMDAGPIVVQAAVPVAADDTAQTLAARVLTAEHRIYPQALRLMAEGRIRIRDDRVLIDGAVPSAALLISPSDGGLD